MKTWLKQPLLHFLALGAGIFLLSQWIGASDAATEARRILVDDQALREFVQYRSRNYDRDAADRTLKRLSPAELEDVISELIREEALYREAKALNLGANDYVIRLRLVQKMNFIAEGSAAAIELGDGDAERHYQQNPEDYYIEPTITFAHVYFGRQRRGAEAARALAAEKRDELNRSAAPLAAATRHGDRFLYHVNYVERTLEFVSSHFGNAMAKRLFAEPADAQHWLGPFESEHGFHAVLVTANSPGRLPKFTEVAEQAGRDARRRLTRKHREAALQAVIDRYDVQVELTGVHPPPSPPPLPSQG